jgi:signal transduction histidine kinase
VHAREEFISIASHELRNPLQSLLLVSQTLQRAQEEPGGLSSKPELVRRAVGTVERQCRRLSRLVDSLLDVARARSGQLELELGPVDLAQVARSVVDLFREQLGRASCEVQLRAPAAVVGLWDRSRLEQVASNLLSNAIKYGAGRPIEIAVESSGGTARLAVRDHGIGIDRGALPGIFDPFTRAVSPRHHAGLGLGLFIVRQIVSRHGGRIAVESELGRGTTFTVELPIAGPAAKEPSLDAA